MRRRGENGFPNRPQVLERSFVILDVLANSREDLSLADLEERLNLHKSTYYRLLRTLEHHRYAEKDPLTGKYRLGSKLLELASKALSRFDLATIGRPFLEKLSSQSGETAVFGVLNDRQMVQIAVVDGKQALRMSVTVGGKSPAHCTSLGKAILAFLPEEEVNLIVRKDGLKPYTPNTITRRSKLMAELAQIRNRGFAIDDQELEIGLKCIASVVRDQSGGVVGALSIAGSAMRLDRKQVSLLAPIVARSASEFSMSLGYRPMPFTPTANGLTKSRNIRKKTP
jgi:IclR family transcriptional regulator, KDG regulon repressor